MAAAASGPRTEKTKTALCYQDTDGTWKPIAPSSTFYSTSSTSSTYRPSGIRYFIGACLVGPDYVGKKNLVSRFAGDGFCDHIQAHYGNCEARAATFDIYLSPSVPPERVKCHLRVVYGSRRGFPSDNNPFRNSYFLSFLVVDITNDKSLKSINDYATMVRDETFSRDPTMILIGNKADDIEHKQVTEEQLIAKAAELNCEYGGITSAKDGSSAEFLRKLLEKKLVEMIEKCERDLPDPAVAPIRPTVRLSTVRPETHDADKCVLL